jgi:Predicted transcriptional regulator
MSVEALARDLGGLSRNHLHKVVQTLSSLGLVRTIRGNGGGVILAKAPHTIKIGSLIATLEGDQPVVECFRDDGGCCALSSDCRLKGFLGSARGTFYRDMDRHTIADCLPAAKLASFS